MASATRNAADSSVNVAELQKPEHSSDPLPVFRPLQSGAGGPELLLVVVPGAFTPPEAYLPLAAAIHAGSADVRLWLGLLRFDKNIPTTAAIVELLKELLAGVRAEGFQGGTMFRNHVYLMGHSWGAWESRVAARQLAQGLIQASCSFAREVEDDIGQYPLPVLTVGGTLDGQIPATELARNGRQVASLQPVLGEGNTLFAKPVVLIEGANHASFSHGVPDLERGDMPAELPLEEGRAAIASVVNAFLAVQAHGPGGARAEAHARALREAVLASKALYDPFWDAVAEEKEGCEQYQVKLLADAGVALPPSVRVEVLWHTYQDNFVSSKPWVDVQQGKVFATAHLLQKGRYGTADALCLKMKSPESVARTFDLGDSKGAGIAAQGSDGSPSPALEAAVKNFDPTDSAAVGAIIEAQRTAPGSNTFAATANRAAFDAALDRLPPYFRARYERLQLTVQFPDDTRCRTSSDWIKGDISVSFAEDGSGHVEVVSPILILPDNPALGRFSGHHYVKVWTVARAMRWIMYDSFRRGVEVVRWQPRNKAEKAG